MCIHFLNPQISNLVYMYSYKPEHVSRKETKSVYIYV